MWVSFGIEEEVNQLLFGSKCHDLHLIFICPGLLSAQDVEYVFGTLFSSCILHLLFCSHIDAGRDWGQEEKGTTEDEMAGWHCRLDGHEFG